MRHYLDLLGDVLDNGVDGSNRTGVRARSVFGRQVRIDLADGFPLLTTKKLHLKSIIVELLWFLRGDSNIAYLNRNGVTIWDEWAAADGDLGPVYGRQWRRWSAPDGRHIDQIVRIRDELIRNPSSRRLVVSAWNPADIEDMSLPPCHCLFQFRVVSGRLCCMMVQRSVDVFLGFPFNMASYGLLTMLMARATGLQPAELVYSLGDVHLYANHVDQAREQLARSPRTLPRMLLADDKTDLFGWEYGDFTLTGYDPHPHIAAPVAV